MVLRRAAVGAHTAGFDAWVVDTPMDLREPGLATGFVAGSVGLWLVAWLVVVTVMHSPVLAGMVWGTCWLLWYCTR